jgi:hypothetical protein
LQRRKRGYLYAQVDSFLSGLVLSCPADCVTLAERLWP